jgi:hypothetical protein
MGIEGELPTPEQVAYIRKEIVKYVEENGQGEDCSLAVPDMITFVTQSTHFQMSSTLGMYNVSSMIRLT